MSDLVLARRSFLKGLGAAALITAPAIVQINNLMPVKRIIIPRWQFVTAGLNADGQVVKHGMLATYQFSMWIRSADGPLTRVEDIPDMTFESVQKHVELAEVRGYYDRPAYNTIDGVED